MKKLEITTQGLSCASCGQKIEQKINQLDGVNVASVDVIQEKIKVTFEHLDEELLYHEVKDIVDTTEPGVTLSLVKQSRKARVEPFALAKLSIAVILFLLSTVVGAYGDLLILIAYGIVGYDILWLAFRNVLRKDFFDENFLMSIATLGAIAINEIPEALAVMLFYKVGELLQDMAIDYSRKSIHDLVELKVDTVHVLDGEHVVERKAEAVLVGDLILVRKGEKAPLDGIVEHGTSGFDCSAINGESKLQAVSVGDPIFAGSINKGESITIKATRDYHHSTIANMLEMMEDASAKKAKSEQFITKFSRVYTPAVVVFSLCLLIGMVLLQYPLHDAVYRAMIFLVISCPCALVISIPLSFFAAIGKASKMGVLVKGGQYLEALQQVDTIAFDKTGTLTKGSFRVVEVKAEAMETNRMISIVKSLEVHSTHPIAQAIARLSDGSILSVRAMQEVAGAGIEGEIDGIRYGFGNAVMMQRFGLTIEGNGLHLASIHGYHGFMRIEDELKVDANEAIAALSSLGLDLVLLSGDSEDVVTSVAQALNIQNAHGACKPEDKLAYLQTLKDGGKRFAFIGDGINDAPSLALADVGIAMGAMGSDMALESADIILLNDDLKAIASSIALSKHTRRIVVQNIVFVLAVKVIVLILGTLGYATMWMALFADVGVSILVILNAMRLLRDRR
ncbi:MAG: heavy metal translocating P-type ATPase [Erysipelotrichaceae bacterium]